MNDIPTLKEPPLTGINAQRSRSQMGRRVHPARRTRRLVGGISISSTFGLIAAMFLAAQAEASESEDVLEPPTTTVPTTQPSLYVPFTPSTTTTTTMPPPPPVKRQPRSSNTKTKGS